jgi:acid phosphatase family membrane protein YuiD
MTPWYLNVVLWSALAGWFLAQLVKICIMLLKSGRINFRLFVSTGGMPSAHSCMVSSLATAVGLEAGFGSALFAVSAAFAAIVMFDAQSVRKAAGQQARVLNKMMDELFHKHKIADHRLAELLGHTRLEVFVGTGLGILTALALRWWFRLL